MELQLVKKINSKIEKKLILFLSDIKFLKYYWIKNINPQNLIKHTLFEIDKQDIIIIAEEKSQIIGLLTFSKINWDTEYFGYGVGKIEHLLAKGDYDKKIKVENKIINFLFQEIKKNFKFISIRINTQDISTVHCVEKNRFNLITTELMYAWYKDNKLPLNYEVPKNLVIRKFNEKDLPFLIDMAEYFTTNRFVSDVMIPEHKARGVYENWIKNACNNTFSGQDEVFVGEINKEIVAFTTAKVNTQTKDTLDITIGIPGLVGVVPKYRGLNINPYIMTKAILSLFKKADVVCAPSHITNIIMINSEHKAGATLVETSYIFHKWIKGN